VHVAACIRLAVSGDVCEDIAQILCPPNHHTYELCVSVDGNKVSRLEARRLGVYCHDRRKAPRALSGHDGVWDQVRCSCEGALGVKPLKEMGLGGTRGSYDGTREAVGNVGGIVMLADVANAEC
jgi:hypothetical protein